MKCVTFVSDTFTCYGSNITNVWQEILTPMTLSFSGKVVHEKLWKSVNICKSYGKKSVAPFLCGHSVYVLWIVILALSSHWTCTCLDIDSLVVDSCGLWTWSMLLGVDSEAVPVHAAADWLRRPGRGHSHCPAAQQSVTAREAHHFVRDSDVCRSRPHQKRTTVVTLTPSFP